MDIIAGSLVGWSEIIIGFPFLTVKCLQQNNQKWFPLPPTHYYRGVKYPFVSSVILNMSVFPLNERSYPYTNNYFLSGLFSGAVISPVVYLIDTYTIRKQTGMPLQGFKMFKGVNGLGSTFGKETLAMSSYFGTYHSLKENHGSFLAGGAAGLANWTLSFPFDTIKSRQLSRQINFKQAFKEGHLWKGYPIAALRSVIVNSVGFTVYEKAIERLRKH